MNTIKLNKKELCEVLDVSLKGLEHIELRKQLEDRLLQKGFKFISKYKIGRSVAYEITLIEDVKGMTFDEFCKKYKIRKKVAFKKHIWNRCNSIMGKNSLATKSDFANKIKVSIYDINKFDKALKEERIMKEKDYMYIKWVNGKREYTTQQEYNDFWTKHSAEKKILASLYAKLENGEMSAKEHHTAVTGVNKGLEREGTIIHKVRAYSKGSEFDKVLTLIEDNNQVKFNI